MDINTAREECESFQLRRQSQSGSQAISAGVR